MPTQSDKKSAAQGRALRVTAAKSAPGKTGFTQRFRFHAKRLAWRLTVRTIYALKRLFDLIVAMLSLTLSMPLLIGIALFIRFDSMGPVLHRQTRLGRWGKLFTLWTFRCETLSARPATLTVNNGRPALTRVGRRLRQTSLDKLPQLWNIVRGDLSLLGPPPLSLAAVDGYALADRQRLEIIPGLLQPHQASTVSAHLDSTYFRSTWPWPALRCLFQVIPAIFFGRAAY